MKKSDSKSNTSIIETKAYVEMQKVDVKTKLMLPRSNVILILSYVCDSWILNKDLAKQFLQATRSYGSLITSRLSCALSIPIHSPTNYCLVCLVIFSRRLYPAIWSVLNMVLSRVPFALTTCPTHLSFLLLTISGSVSYFPMCPAKLLCVSSRRVYVSCNTPTTVFSSNCFRLPLSVCPDLC